MGTDLINQVLLNQYRVDAFIASGGMGTVYRVWDLKRNVPLAMKVIHADLADDPSMAKRFKREANALKKLAHPNIVPFYGLYQTAEFAFLLERYVDGPSLKDILRKSHRKTLPFDETLTYLKALSAALGYAHANGVVHCDVKPGNVMVDQGGNIYLTDFGIARHTESTTTTLVTTGTAAYMAPEQIRGEPVSPATDTYALGVMLFEMLTGQPPFKGDEKGTESSGSTPGERIRYAHIHLVPPDPRAINPTISIPIESIIYKALEKDPAKRFISTGELFTTLCAATGSNPGAIMDRVPSSSINLYTSINQPRSGTSDLKYGSPVSNRKEQFNKSKPVWILLAISGFFVLLIGLKLFTTYSQHTKTSLPIAPIQTESLLIQSPTIISSKTSHPILPAILIPTNTPIPTATLTPTQTSTPPEIREAIDGADIVFVPAGDFIMGSDPNEDPYFWGAEGPPHRVYLDSFWIYRTEVTNAMYQVCAAEKACPRPEQFSSRTREIYYENPDYANYPVIFVDYVDATAYCLWAGGRLPTEAEWEKAARGSDERLFPWGNNIPSGDKVNYCDWNCSEAFRESMVDDGYRDTAPIGSYPVGSSPYGVLDMSGNVWEWTADWMGSLYYEVSPEKNPLGPSSGTRRVLRGGSWFNPIDAVRTVNRFSAIPSTTMDVIGFRCVTSP